MRCDLAALQQRGIAAGQLGPELGALLRAGGGAVQAQQVGPHLDAQLWQTALRAPPDPAFYLTQSFRPPPADSWQSRDCTPSREEPGVHWPRLGRWSDCACNGKLKSNLGDSPLSALDPVLLGGC